MFLNVYKSPLEDILYKSISEYECLVPVGKMQHTRICF